MTFKMRLSDVGATGDDVIGHETRTCTKFSLSRKTMASCRRQRRRCRRIGGGVCRRRPSHLSPSCHRPDPGPLWDNATGRDGWKVQRNTPGEGGDGGVCRRDQSKSISRLCSPRFEPAVWYTLPDTSSADGGWRRRCVQTLDFSSASHLSPPRPRVHCKALPRKATRRGVQRLPCVWTDPGATGYTPDVRRRYVETGQVPSISHLTSP